MYVKTEVPPILYDKNVKKMEHSRIEAKVIKKDVLDVSNSILAAISLRRCLN
jgi:hypothetical protein